MTKSELNLRIESQIKFRGNYIKNNALNLCNEALKIYKYFPDTIKEINEIKKAIEEVKEPWQSSGIPSRKETNEIILYLYYILEFIL